MRQLRNLAVAAMLLAPPAIATPYSLILFAPPWPGMSLKQPLGMYGHGFFINNHGTVAGTVEGNGTVHGFAKRGGESYIKIIVPGASKTFVTGINNHGEVGGYYCLEQDCNEIEGAQGFFIYRVEPTRFADQIVAKLIKLGDVPDRGNVLGGPNNDRQFVGHIRTLSGPILSFGFRYTPDDPFPLLPLFLQNSDGTNPAAINDDETMAGFDGPPVASGYTNGFVWNGGIDVFQYPQSVWTRAFGINNKNAVVGSFTNPGEELNRRHGFVREAGVYKKLDWSNNARHTDLYSINDHGQIAGVFFSGPPGENGPFAFTASPIRFCCANIHVDYAVLGSSEARLSIRVKPKHDIALDAVIFGARDGAAFGVTGFATPDDSLRLHIASDGSFGVISDRPRGSGETVHVEFTLVGRDLETLDDASFLDRLSVVVREEEYERR